MEQPLVSIVVVSYNHSKYIRENLDSIKAQTYPNIELIVADDASKDNSVEIFESWLAENNYPAKKNFHQQNTGLATTLNECTDMISGKYVKMIAADDYMHPEAIEKCVAKLEELGEEYGMVFTDTYAVDGDSVTIKDFANYSELGNVSAEIFRKELLKGNRIAALTVLMRTVALKSTGRYDNQFLAEDYYRWLKINEKYYIAYVDLKLFYYRIHGENISIAKEERLKREALQLQLMFDKTGYCKEIINSQILFLYRTKSLENEVKTVYLKYPWRSKRIATSIKNNLPYKVFHIINQLI